MYGVSAKVKDPDTIIKFIDWMYSEGFKYFKLCVEGETFELMQMEATVYRIICKDFVDAQPAPCYAIYSDLGITKLLLTLGM